MLSDDSGRTIAEQATNALGSLARYGDALRPSGADDLTWRLEMLDEFVRTGSRFAAAVAQVVGEADPSITWLVRELAAAVDLHCDRVVRAVRERSEVAALPAVAGGARVVPFPTPYVRPARPEVTDNGAHLAGPLVGAPAEQMSPSDPAALLEQRTAIHTATGVLMVQHECDAETAYALLVGRARQAGTSPFAVAVQVISAQR
ncbi:ANTAR domain-containing protein [Actinomycetospora endophytica]|uniref:ANTAR domain-containing protein n=1 Tax=Actinomycetospora endophytica TaxID=2291215 RepID=A0ABS8PEG1_9PSEU|nr:ANTAR domain-containing protein [Actinomycetospora endophytica]MCD2196641.1 ANTAR domain-containing protein [Actinomycetospora endophytica]